MESWLIKHHAELKDSQIVKLIGTTKDTINKIRERTHWNIANITAKHPYARPMSSRGFRSGNRKGRGSPNAEEQVTSLSEFS